ncbi:MAG: hypothetical protein AB7O32_03055 [Vicinamibacterales bacterium]
MRTRLLVTVLTAALLHPVTASAWGFAAHQLVMRRAIELLPPELTPLFEKHREEVVLRVVDPDLWRNVGWADDPNHFVDFGAKEFGDYPFTGLPRDLGAAIEKFGQPTLDRNGRLPWRLGEIFGQLRRAFEGFARQSPYAISDVVLFSAVASHYVQDAHQPFHATDDYDGQKAGQRGIHARFERDLIERFASRLRLTPPSVVPMKSPSDRIWDILLASHRLVAPVLEADRAAADGREFYDDAYFEAFFVKTQPILEQQLGAAASATAALITGAWIEAGRPAISLVPARPVQKIERGK